MGIQLGSNFSLQTGAPLDERLVCQTLEERDALPIFKRYIGMMCYVESEQLNYQLIGGVNNEYWTAFKAGGMHIGPEAPNDTNQIWFNTSDETPDSMIFPEQETLDQFRDTVNHMSSNVNQLKHDFQHINAGEFIDEGTTSMEPSEGNITYLKIKNGLNTNLRPLRQGELAYCHDTNRLYIGARPNMLQETITNICISGSGSGGSESGGNLTGEYIELTSHDETPYRVYVADDGKLRVVPTKYFEIEDPSPDDNARFAGLIINRAFGGGAPNNNVSPISHGFIELYNNNAQMLDISLKGLSLHYRTKADGVWQKLELEGYIPYQHSFLIRCARHNLDHNATCRHIIKEYDMDWPQVALADGGFMLYLGVGRDVLMVQNPFNYNFTGLKVAGYIDMFVLGKEGVEDSLNAYEGKYGYYPNFGNFYTGAQRIDFKDKDNSYGDIEKVNYQTCDINIYRPRSTLDGPWDLYYNKIKLNNRVPNMMNICYGQEQTTRTFTWQSAVTDVGYLRYRPLDSYRWTVVETEREMVRHHDQDCTIHRVIVHGLTAGIYEYQAGEEGAWSDVSTFEVIEHEVTDETDHIKFLQVSDQQGFYESEYDAWKWAVKYIEHNEDFEWVLNSGDISQNANRSFEWRYYYKHSNFNREKCHMVCCGNNDLVDKKYSYAFNYYLTLENVAELNHDSEFDVASCHSWDLGFVHFISLNTNVAEDSDLIVKQMSWVKTDVEAARVRPNPPRWIIMYAHHGPFTVTRMKSAQQLIPFVEDLEIDVFICGHHHSYSRSKFVRMNKRVDVERETGHDLYDVYRGCGNAIANAMYKVGYLEAFKDNDGNPSPPNGCTIDQVTQEGEEGNVKSADKYLDEATGIPYIMCQATGYKLKSNKDLEKSPTPWWYGFRGEHPYDPSYIMWDIGWDEIRVEAKSVTGIMVSNKLAVTDNTLDSQVLADNIDMDKLGCKVIDTMVIRHKSLR